MRNVITQIGLGLVLTSPVTAYLLWALVSEPHLHPDTGPHRGVIVEWDASHGTVAEAVQDPRTGVVTVYVLDRWAARPSPLKARSITLTLAADGPVVELVAAPTRRDPSGASSRFHTGRVRGPGRLAGFSGTLSATADGRRYAGSFEMKGDR